MSEAPRMSASLDRILAEEPVSLRFAETRPLPPPGSPAFLHPFPRFLYGLSGERRITCGIEGEIIRTTLKPGALLFSPPGGWVAESPGILPGEALFSVVLLRNELRFIHVSDVKRLYHTNRPPSETLRHIFSAILAEQRDSSIGRRLFKLLAELLQSELEASLREALSESDQLWKTIREFIEMNLAEELNREFIAARNSISPENLSRLIREKTGLALRAYVNELRLQYARELLRNPRLSIEEIASHAGYHYSNYFIRAYRKKYQTSPGSDRKLISR